MKRRKNKVLAKRRENEHHKFITAIFLVNIFPNKLLKVERAEHRDFVLKDKNDGVFANQIIMGEGHCIIKINIFVI